MRIFLTALIAGIALFGMSHNASAQIANAALGQAKARLACGAGTVVASVFLPNGSLKVTCAQAPSNAASTAVQATGLTGTASLAVVGVVTILTVLTGGEDSSTTSSTTDSGSEGGEGTR